MGCPESDTLEERILEVRRRDRRYARSAYYFVLDAIDHTMVHLGRTSKAGEERHVGGRELLDGIKELAAEEFGPMAPEVFRQWGIADTGDFGEIVFNLIDGGLLSRRAQDSRLDFLDGFDFESTFAEKFRARLSQVTLAPK
jgi:uncharacterized repeat protein (TIGR04138 family)